VATQSGAATAAAKTLGPGGAPVAAPNSQAAVPAAPVSIQTGAVNSLPANDEARWRPALGLPCQLAVDLPVPDFRIFDLLKLRRGSLVDARWRLGHDLPLRLNGTLIGWSKIEVMNNRLAVRLTELA
jgi:flagellar motor switch/type III secretory pathway protein FliN